MEQENDRQDTQLTSLKEEEELESKFTVINEASSDHAPDSGNDYSNQKPKLEFNSSSKRYLDYLRQRQESEQQNTNSCVAFKKCIGIQDN